MLMWSLTLLCLLVLVSHAVLSRRQLRPWPLALGSAASGAVLFQLGNAMHIGHLDPFFPIALVVSLPPALLVAWLLQVAQRWWRARR